MWTRHGKGSECWLSRRVRNALNSKLLLHIKVVAYQFLQSAMSLTSVHKKAVLISS
jgi:hypothetical protein